MTKATKNESEMLESINKIQALLTMIDKKVDTLIRRQVPEASPTSKPAENTHHNERVMHKAICADCRKECSLPFKPSGDRPVYCQDCFSRRKVMKMSGMTGADKPQAAPSIQKPETKPKKAAAPKKPAAKKKPTAKKK